MPQAVCRSAARARLELTLISNILLRASQVYAVTGNSVQAFCSNCMFNFRFVLPVARASAPRSHPSESRTNPSVRRLFRHNGDSCRSRYFTVLAIESSADDTCAAIVTSSRHVVSNVVIKQHNL
ncbi:hypothetical protein J3R82DRAFT_7423 [Butyriboletus roseoflavus]|nr:hypothetical protein J3R82DRAFT_9239 [Butyriboletus roseoflavus]KAG8215577.1 hypothetical protein J3R82DRAFT_7423 [Butyriboletus roseoflavus]